MRPYDSSQLGVISVKQLVHRSRVYTVTCFTGTEAQKPTLSSHAGALLFFPGRFFLFLFSFQGFTDAELSCRGVCDSCSKASKLCTGMTVVIALCLLLSLLALLVQKYKY
jgi:hypothetical protein